MFRNAAVVAFAALAALSAACGPGRRDAGVENPDFDGSTGLDVQIMHTEIICSDGQTLCGTTCFDTQNDPRHCGSCSDMKDCTRLPGVIADRVTCRMGVCDIRNACPVGRGYCDGDINEGCSVDLTQADKCGSCTRMCADPTPACSLIAGDGGSSYQCTSGCTGMTPMRCGMGCVDPMSDVMNCGRCGNTCMAPPNARPLCSSGSCASECLPGFLDCDGDTANGCETDARTDEMNCGRCRRTCPLAPNGMPECRAGICGVACNAGFLNCDGNDTNGCELNGASNTSNCGMCGNACMPAAGAAPRCESGMCVTGCMRGFADCDSNTANGCETNIATNVMTCGGCETRCPATVTNGTSVCNDGMCGIRCNAGFADCDGNAMNGCEVRTDTDTANCGACERACTTGTNQVATCAAGRCAVSCAPGFTDCDGDAMNGCEASFQTDARNCGRCGNMCLGATNAPPTCVSGACVFACATGYTNCNGMMADGCEVNTGSSINDCGTCGTQCRPAANAAPACNSGVCDIQCAENFADCNRNTADGCETGTSANLMNCGGCGRICLDGAHGTKACRMGTCGFNCEAGWGDCDTLLPNGCEAALNTVVNCGRCGNSCEPQPGTTVACTMSACTYTCMTGWMDCDMNVENGCEARPGTMCPM